VQTHTPLYLARAPSRVPARTKKAFRGIAPEGLVLRHCRALGRSTPLGVIEHAAVVAADPRLCHGSAPTHGGPLDAGHVGWPRHRRALRIGEQCGQLEPRTSM
jgi:hypothetical protein